MNNSLSTLELLSNKLLINIFRYLNTVDIFQSFYNLNLRFNTIIQSLDNHHLTISGNHHKINFNSFSHYIHSLTITGEIDINLYYFKNIRHLTLHFPSAKLLEQLNHNILPNLEYLSIPDILFGMSPIYQKIFSSTFPNLKSCNLYGFETIETILTWTQTTSLRILKIGLIDYHVYKSILHACPNLYYFKLKMFQSYLKLSNIYEHFNLKKLEIHSDINDWYYNDQLIDIFLQCVPNLEQLSIDRIISVSKIVELIPDYNWLASIISLHLSSLQYFNFCLHLEYHYEVLQFLSTEIRRLLRQLFFNAHQNHYQSRFIIK